MTTMVTPTTDERLERLALQVDYLVAEADERRALKESLSDLTGDITPIARQSMESLAAVLADLDQRGYIDFARSGAGVVDRIVTSFSEEDVEALGDNIVLILETVKEMTQPEVMTMLQSSFHNAAEIDEGTEPPSLFALLRQMRDPEVRLGLARLIAVLRSMGTSSPKVFETEKGEAK